MIRRTLGHVTRRNSDEVSLDIVMALLVGVPVGIVMASAVGGVGWMTGNDLGGLAGWLGVSGAAIVVGWILWRSERSERSARRTRKSADA